MEWNGKNISLIIKEESVDYGTSLWRSVWSALEIWGIHAYRRHAEPRSVPSHPEIINHFQSFHTYFFKNNYPFQRIPMTEEENSFQRLNILKSSWFPNVGITCFVLTGLTTEQYVILQVNWSRVIGPPLAGGSIDVWHTRETVRPTRTIFPSFGW